MFALDPAFEAVSAPLADLELCAARLVDDARWPWIVLIPRRASIVEVEDLSNADRLQLMTEIVQAGAAVRAVGAACGSAVEKLNVGLLGNVTPQLHAHVVGRRAGDPGWPGPVWGFGAARRYAAEALETAREAALAALA
jgi:diadenosine tetraphosphate (Ap4A) HIT family hydrolase